MFIDLLIWILRKSKRSVLIGYEITEGQIKPLNNFAYIYDNTFNDVDYRLLNGEKFTIADGEFFFLN